MKRSVRFFLIINLLCVCLAQAQTSEEVVAFANDQFGQGHYEIAAKEYNPALFFGSPEQDFLALRIAQCYFETGNLELSAEFFDKAYSYTRSDSLQNEAILGKSFCLILQAQHMLALAELINFNETTSQLQNSEYHFLNGIALFSLERDTLAYEKFVRAMAFLPDEGPNLEQLDQVFARVYKLRKRFSPNRAYIMSVFLPGLGQMSVGEWKEGLNSMVLIGILFVITQRIAIAFSFGDALITIMPWLQRYYMGGMDKSKELAVARIERERYRAYTKILELSTPIRYQ
jgi:tetratricopeptide (TPR) repeat protein